MNLPTKELAIMAAATVATGILVISIGDKTATAESVDDKAKSVESTETVASAPEVETAVPPSTTVSEPIKVSAGEALADKQKAQAAVMDQTASGDNNATVIAAGHVQTNGKAAQPVAPQPPVANAVARNPMQMPAGMQMPPMPQMQMPPQMPMSMQSMQPQYRMPPPPFPVQQMPMQQQYPMNQQMPVYPPMQY